MRGAVLRSSLLASGKLETISAEIHFVWCWLNFEFDLKNKNLKTLTKLTESRGR